MRAMRAQLFVAVFSALLVTGPAYGQSKWSSLKPIPQGEEEAAHGHRRRREALCTRRAGRLSGLGTEANAVELRSGYKRVDQAAEPARRYSSSRLGRSRWEALSVGGSTIARPPTGSPAWVPSKSVRIDGIGQRKGWSKGPDLPTARGRDRHVTDGNDGRAGGRRRRNGHRRRARRFSARRIYAAAAISAIRASAAAAVRS